MTVRSTVHGFPRIGDRRELKTATEGYWAGRVPAEELEATARELRRQAWTFLRDAGVGQVPSNHFSLYDQVLDTCVLVGAVPERHGDGGGEVDLDTYFAMARGRADATAMEMTKWFDTNYHYLVPELGRRAVLDERRLVELDPLGSGGLQLVQQLGVHLEQRVEQAEPVEGGRGGFTPGAEA